MDSTDSKGFRYRRIAAKLAGMIDQGVLRTGERVPSVRRISAQEGVSVSTILQAYTLLETRGYLEARPQSGFYVRSRRESLPPEPRAPAPSRQATRVWVSELVSVLQAGLDPEVVPLGEACPTMDLLPGRKLNRMLAALARRGGLEINDHSFPPGNYEFRRQVARRSIDWGANLRPEEIVTTFGATEALHLCLRAVTQPGDLVAIETPTYFGILLLLEHLNLQAVEIPSHPRTGMDLDRLADACRKHRIRACVGSPNFSNPNGSCMSEGRKRDLVELLARRSIPLIEDDIWGDLYFSGTRPKTAKAFDKEGLVLLCSSFSKMLSPSYRVGWAAAGRYQAKVESLKLTATMETSTLLQMVVAEFLENGGYDRHLRRLRAAFALQVDQALAAIGAYFPAGTKVTRPAGGFVLWVELPRSVNAIELHSRALAEGVNIAPGPLFSARKGYQNYIRLSCSCPWSPRVEKAIATLGRLAGR